MSKRLFFLTISCIWIAGTTAASEKQVSALTLQSALSQAYATNPEIAAAAARTDAERSAVRSQSFLDDPRIGYSHEANMNFMEMSQGAMDLLSISQEIKFPMKYVLLNRVQNAKAAQAEEVETQKKLEVRSKVIAGYYDLFAVDRVLTLLSAQRESLREIARTAESRYATGSVPEQDEMKAHVEQTEIEKDILMVEEEHASAEAALHALLGQDTDAAIPIPKEELPSPRITVDLAELTKMGEHHSRHIREAQAIVDQSQAFKSLAQWSYAPDFNLSYQRALGSYFGQNAYAAEIEITFPLWFLTKQSSEVAAASARENESEQNFEAVKLDHVAEMRSLAAKVSSTGKIIEIYHTGLIPQAESTLNSSRASYRAGRSSFIELLDSERSLYTVKIAYYRSLAQFAEQVSKLEEIMGESISNLPFGGPS